MAEEEQSNAAMDAIQRIYGLITSTRSEWEAIAPEPVSVVKLYLIYVLPLAAISPLASFFGSSFVGIKGFYKTPALYTALTEATAYVLSVAAVFVLSAIIFVLAPIFSGKRDFAQAT